jgi:hypothetical protein
MNIFVRGHSSILAVFMAVCITTPSFAAQKTYPSISGEIPIEIENDWTFKSDDRANQSNDLYTTIEPAVTVQLSPSWSIFGHAVLEPVGSAGKFENRTFEDIGFYIEDLFVEFNKMAFNVKAGKLNAGFGVAWDRTPGLYGTDLAEDGYETSERIGVIGGWIVDGKAAGTHTVSVGSFFQDITFLSQSVLKGRGDTRKGDGGVSNTEDFSSFIVALNGEKIKGLGNFGYHISYMHQANGVGDPSDETSFAIAGFTSFDFGKGVTFSPMVEFVRQENPGGVQNQDRDFLTVASQLEWRRYNLAAAWTKRHTFKMADDRDYQFQLSAGYSFDFGLSVDLGWKIAEEGNVETQTVGMLASYLFKF